MLMFAVDVVRLAAARSPDVVMPHERWWAVA